MDATRALAVPGCALGLLLSWGCETPGTRSNALSVAPDPQAGARTAAVVEFPATQPVAAASHAKEPESEIAAWAERLAEQRARRSAERAANPEAATNDVESLSSDPVADAQLVHDAIYPVEPEPAAATSAAPAMPPAASVQPTPAPAEKLAAPVVNGAVVSTASLTPPASAAPSANAATAGAGDLDRALAALLSGPADTSFRKQLDRRILQVLAGNVSGAREPIELASSEQQAMATKLIDMLLAIREGGGGEPSAEIKRVLEHVDGLRESLTQHTPITISALEVCRAVRGFGQYERIDAALPAGRELEVVLYCELRDFASANEADGAHRSEFSLRTQLLSRSGDVLLDLEDPNIVDRCRTRRRDCFIPRLLRLPDTLSPGEYVVKVTVTDKITRTVAQRSASLRLSASD